MLHLHHPLQSNIQGFGAQALSRFGWVTTGPSFPKRLTQSSDTAFASRHKTLYTHVTETARHSTERGKAAHITDTAQASLQAPASTTH